MVHVEVLSAHRVPGDAEVERGDEPIALADVRLDGRVVVQGVAIVDGLINRAPRAIPPRRPYGDGAAVLAWPQGVGEQIAAAVLRALDGKVAIAA